MKTSVTRYHDISCGHRVVGHEGKCRLLHGHNYRIWFTVEATSDKTLVEGQDVPLDHVGRVIDFSVIKRLLCQWLENAWDHRFLVWVEDPFIPVLVQAIGDMKLSANGDIDGSLVFVEFNPTAENLAGYLLRDIGPALLRGMGVRLTKVKIDETRKCSAEVSI